MATVSPDSPAPSGASSARKLKLPLASLAVDGTNPEQGDEVTFTVTGKLSSVSGEDGEVEVSKINDADLGVPAPEMSEDEAAFKAVKDADGDGY